MLVCNRCESLEATLHKSTGERLCKKCKYDIWYRNNPEKVKEYWINKKEKLDKSYVLKAIQNLKNEQQRKNRIKKNPYYKTKETIRSRLNTAFKTYSKNGKIQNSKDYGIDYQAIFEKVGPKPNDDFQLDHIIPISKFNLDDPEQVLLCHSPENFRWIPSNENLMKSDKIVEIVFENETLKNIYQKICA